MRDRFRTGHWMLVILLLGVLVAAPAARAGSTVPIQKPANAPAQSIANGTTIEPVPPTFSTPSYVRQAPWWPFTSGPYYGDAANAAERTDDLLVTPVGSFRIGDHLQIPAELTATLNTLNRGGAQYFLVQLRPSALEQPFAQALASMGATIVDEVPVNGLVLRMDRAAHQLVSSSPLIQYIQPYHPAYRISPAIGTMPQPTEALANAPALSLAIRLFPGEPVQPAADALRRLGVNVTQALPVEQGSSYIYAEAEPRLIPAIAHVEAVALVLESNPTHVMGTRGTLFLQSEKATIADYPYWKVALQGDGQVIQLTDSGMSVNAGDKSDTRTVGGWNAALPDHVIANHRKVIAYRQANDFGGAGDLKGCDALTNGNTTHGQITAGVAAGGSTRGYLPTPAHPSPTDDAATNPNRTWINPYGNGFFKDQDGNGNFSEYNDVAFDGVAKGAKIVFVDASTSCPEIANPGLSPGNLQTTIENTWTNYKASIHNFSFGTDASPTTGPVYNTSASQIDTAILNKPINVVTISAGNAGAVSNGNGSSNAIGNASNEATCKNCLSTGASWDVQGLMAGYTSEGPGPGKRHIITVLAEGYDNVCRRDGAEDQTITPTCIDGGYHSGTSFAAPNLAGAIAIAREYFAEGFYPDGTDGNPQNANDKVKAISGRLVRALMIASTKTTTGRDTGEFMPKYRLNHASGYGQAFLTRVLPLAAYAQNTVPGLIVHDLPGDIDGDGTSDGVSSLSLPATLPTTVTSYTSDFTVLDDKNDLTAAIVWDDPASGGTLVNDVDLELKYCGPDGTCGNGDDITWMGNTFTEDINEDGTQQPSGTPPEVDLNHDNQITGYWYTISNSDITAGGGTPANYRNKKDNSEGIFIPTKLNAPDLNSDGTPDLQFLDDISRSGCTYANPCPRTGKWQVTVYRRTGTTNNMPYSVVIAGPVSAGSSVRFDTNPVTCNGDEDIVVNETNDASDPSCTAASCPASVIQGRTSVKVYNTSGVLVDTEDNPLFATPASGSLRFTLSKRMPITSVGTPTNNDGILEAQNGYTIKVTYDDNNGAVQTKLSSATVDCQPNIDLYKVGQIGADEAFVLAGGCDGDRYLDQGEQFSMLVQFFNVDPVELADATATLAAYNFGTSTPSPYIQIDQGTKPVGTLASQTLQRTAFGFKVLGTPPARTKVDLRFCVSGAKSGQGIGSCNTFTMLLQSDDEKHYYITDCPTGCTLDYDRNSDERLETAIAQNDINDLDPLQYLHVTLNEKSIHYEDLTDSTHCTGCGNPGFNGPWDFDGADNEGFRTGHDASSKLSSTSAAITNWGEDSDWDGSLNPAYEDPNGNGILDQNWNTKGGCGWMTKGAAAAAGGIWHTGTIGTWTSAHQTQLCGGATGPRANDGVCEQYDTEAGTTGQAYWFEALRSPTIHPVHFGTDPDTYDWKTKILDWSWNMQWDVPDNLASGTWEFDLDTTDGQQNVLGDDWISKIFGNSSGLIAGGQLELYGGGFAFAPTNKTTGDETNGTKGSNRAGHRGCYFNDLISLSGDGGALTAANRSVRSPDPEDDDCDNDFTLGPDGCPGACGVDDDGNGVIDDPGEICPCKKCAAGSPRAGKPCADDVFCSTQAAVYVCANATDAAGKPTAYGDDVCGDGTTDENVAATFGTNTSIRQVRNADTSFRNGINSGGRGNGNILYNTLEDFYGPAGKDWATEIGFIVYENSSSTKPVQSYGAGIDDMVIEWEESHPIAQAANNCTTGNPWFGVEGQCATITLGSSYPTGTGDRAVPVTVVDAVPDGNLGECTASDGSQGIVVRANSQAELAGETFCLKRTATGSNEFAGTIKITTRIAKQGDGYVYTAFNGSQAPAVTVRYIDQRDGNASHDWSVGPDGRPGIANFDDDGDGTIDNAGEQCPLATSMGPGRSPHLPGTAARWSDDKCGCVNNPIAATIQTAFDTADLIVSDVIVKDGIGGTGLGDADGFADPNETVQIDVKVKNLSDFQMDKVELTISTDSPYVACVLNDRMSIGSIAKHLAPGSEVDTSTLTDPSVLHFKFKPAAVSRTTTGQDFSSKWTLTLRALAKAGTDTIGPDGEPIKVDLPIEGTSVVQTFKVTHNLNAPAPARAVDFSDNFESYTNDANAVCTPAAGQTRCTTAPYVKRNTGDDAAELRGTHCQINNPFNPFGNNTDPADYCELGEGYNNSENHWHLQGPKPSTGTTCEQTAGCKDGGRSHGAGKKSLASGKQSAYGAPGDNNITIPMNRMYWVKTRDTYQLGTGLALNGSTPVACTTLPCADQAPVLQYWTQMSITDWRMVGGLNPGTAWDAALTYVCVDKNGNNDCDTKEDGDKSGSENWEALHAYYSPEQHFRLPNFINCMYDPADDGSTEDDFFPGSATLGPSSTCYPQAVDTCVGRTQPDDPLGYMPVAFWAGCWPETGKEGSEGEVGQWGNGKWIKKLYSLKPYRGQKVMFRWHTSPGGLKGIDECDSFTPFCGNRDDGWFIDDIRVFGMATSGLALDNTGYGGTPDQCPNSPTDTLVARVAAVPYPRNDQNSKPKPAVGCSDVSLVKYCDYNNDSTLDQTSPGTGNSDAPGRPFVLDGRDSSAVKCLKGALEYRYEDTLGTLYRDWLTDPTNVVTPTVTTTFVLKVRCSSDTSPTPTISTANLTLVVPTGDACLVSSNQSLRLTHAGMTGTLTWTDSLSPWDIAKGDVTTLRNASGSFAGATCAQNNIASTNWADTASPGTGKSFYYVVRCNGNTYNDGTQTGSRDTTLTACP